MTVAVLEHRPLTVNILGSVTRTRRNLPDGHRRALPPIRTESVKSVIDEPNSAQRRWKCVCAYDGGHFAGWQSQAKSDAVQDIIEARLAQIFGRDVRIHGSGRTDSGVHALGQVFHFDAEWRHAPEKLLAAFRIGLPQTIQVKSVQAVDSQFHSRFQATGKRYEYRIHLGDADPFTRPYAWTVFRPLDTAAMQSAAAILKGRHDFRAFTALNGPEREDTVRDLRRLDVHSRARTIRVVAEADGFLYKMVRSLVGVLVSVGEGKVSPSRVREILASKTRTAEVQTAPPHGLFLVKVFYGK
jgi:tRNA pseudouridine38-40 synthase